MALISQHGLDNIAKIIIYRSMKHNRLKSGESLSNERRAVSFGSSRLWQGDVSNRGIDSSVRVCGGGGGGGVGGWVHARGVWLRRLHERGFKSTGGGGWTMGVLRGWEVIGGRWQGSW